ncbi:TPA: hypothetical protein NJ352_004535 [Vibrio parahaemolyticus]|uniref:hypothetical protein n=1 Tax=Vibrio parahaemolyticus TaxID=670 RepID=UPI0028795A9E|nr:hypothetical protein [Vibrio parahaemolyticus]MDS1868892.1 hypothetical protein [Vibrio parahaemolyticus]HCG7063116.1 hypothetical protein [Vibrio parahaemolyticus]HCG8084941.1 hypothetical protein [Vibrio parahaemolyticus]
MEVNYKNYNAKSLLEALSTIDADAYPENYKNLTEQIALRQEEIDAFYQEQELAQKLKWSRALTFVGVSQVLVALIAIVMLVLSLPTLTMANIGMSIFIVLLNGIAGITLIKRLPKGYLLSFVNLGLQVFSFGAGHFYFNYYGLGGVFLALDWVSDTYNWFSASFNLGGSLFELSTQSEHGFLQVDLLAILYLWVVSKASSKITS